MTATPVSTARPTTPDFRVADPSLADWGRKEIAIAESEMAALMAIRAEFAPTVVRLGARLHGRVRPRLPEL